MQLLKQVKLPKWFAGLRLRYQILFIQLLLLILITGLVFASLFILLKLGSQKITIIAENILVEKIMSRHSNIVSNYYHRRVYQGFRDSEQQLIYINQLFRSAQKQFIQYNLTIDNGLKKNYTQFKQRISYDNSFPYGIFGNQSEQHFYKGKIELSTLLTEFIQLMPRKALLYFTSLSQEQYFSINPGGYYKNYIPHSRPWYSNHLIQMNNEQFPVSDPYPNFLGGMCITKTANLTNNENQLVGIVANDMNMTSFWGLYNVPNVQIQLFDGKGELILSTHYKFTSQNVDYFYNVSVLGYNYSDFLIVTNQTSNTYMSCPIKLQGWECLINKLDNQTYYIQSLKILKYFTIVSFNIQAFIPQLENLYNIQNAMQFNSIQMVLILVFIILILFISFQATSIWLVQIPLERIMYATQLLLKTNSMPKQLQKLIIKSKKNVQLNNLATAFSNLTNNRNISRIRRMRIEQLNNKQYYPYNQPIYPFRFKQFYYFIDDVKDINTLQFLNKAIQKRKIY